MQSLGMGYTKTNRKKRRQEKKYVHLKSRIARARETKMFYKIRIKKREFKKGIYKKRFCCFHNGKHRVVFLPRIS